MKGEFRTLTWYAMVCSTWVGHLCWNAPTRARGAYLMRQDPRALADRRPPCVEWQWHDPGWRRWRNGKQLSADLVFLKERMVGSYFYRLQAALRTNSSKFWESVCHWSLKDFFFFLSPLVWNILKVNCTVMPSSFFK